MFVLPDLTYADDALEPVMSADTVRTHYRKHHRAYVETTNQLLDKLDWRSPTLEAVVTEARRAKEVKLFNNAAQAWNHGFYWASMSPVRTEPSPGLRAAIERDFGDLEGLKAKFVEAGVGHFASGWLWLAREGERLTVTSTHDADDTVGREGVRPLLVCDLWEHAYYLDFKNDRKAFLEAWFDRLANWRFASQQFEGAAWAYPAKVGEPV